MSKSNQAYIAKLEAEKAHLSRMVDWLAKRLRQTETALHPYGCCYDWRLMAHQQTKGKHDEQQN